MNLTETKTKAKTEFDLKLSSGRIRIRRIGSSKAPLVIMVHGLSSHMHAFDFFLEKLATPDRQVVLIDLRGRGRSEVTPNGTYGLESHCRDVLEVATLLGAQRFSLVGWSIGALIGIVAANLAPHRIRHLVLVDHAGKMDAEAVAAVVRGLDRLDVVVPKPSDYVEIIRANGGITPWSDFWERYYRYELGPYGSDYKATTSKSACMEDLKSAERDDWPLLWRGITMPTLLIRCQTSLQGGFIVPESVRDELQKVVPDICTLELACDHDSVMTSLAASCAIHIFINELY